MLVWMIVESAARATSFSMIGTPPTEVGQIPHLLLAQRLAADGQGADRQAGRPELDDDRRPDPRRQEAQGGIGEAGDLGHPGVLIVRGMEVDLDEADAG